jgi:hypothetical protein
MGLASSAPHLLNMVTEPDAYSLPNMMEFTVAGCKDFRILAQRLPANTNPSN